MSQLCVQMSFVLGIVPFRRFSETLVQPYVRMYQGTGYVFFSSTAAHDSRIFTIASIRSPDKEIPVLFQKLYQCLIFSILILALSTARAVRGWYSITSLLNHTYVKRSITIFWGYLFNF